MPVCSGKQWIDAYYYKFILRLKHFLMKYRVAFLIFLSAFLIWQACDKVEPPYMNPIGGGGNNNDTINDTVLVFKRTVLIEEFTGHHCPNCPGGAKAVEDIANAFGDQIVVVSVHTDYFGRTTNDFPVDYRIPEGDVLDKFFKMEARLPSGMVNRTGFETGTHALGPSELSGRVLETLEGDPKVGVHIELDYSNSTRIVEIKTNVHILEELQRPLMFSVFITEDSIVSTQINTNPEIGPTPVFFNYVHRHVLRAAVNGAWGVIIDDGSNLLMPEVVKTITNSYSLSEDWNELQCAVVAFVYDAETREVLHSAEAKIK